MKKKAQGISINAIIVAAIALIVLVVLVAIFTGRMGTWGRGITEATENECGGLNYPKGVCRATCLDKEDIAFGAKCTQVTTDVCCVPTT